MRGAVSSTADALALIDSVTADEVRRVIERMLRQPPALAITGKGASTRSARQVAALLSAATAGARG